MGNINEHDMTKNMLDRLRNLPTTRMNESVETPEDKEVINEHDMTKKMLDTIRTPIINEVIARSGMLLTENEQQDVVKVENDELAEEASKFIDNIGDVDLKLYEVYPSDRNVVMVGKMENGLEFKFSKKEGAPYINVKNMRLDIDSVDMIKKMQAYYIIWAGEWAHKISEYSNSV